MGYEDGPVEQIDLRFRLGDFEDLPADPEAKPAAEKGPSCSAIVEVQSVGSNLFKVAGPVSLTPFGPFGPMLSFGTIIEAKPLRNGAYRYLRSREVPNIWTRVLSCVQPESIQTSEAATLLGRLSTVGCAWEYCAGNLTIQGRSLQLAREPTQEIEGLIAEIAEHVVSRDEFLE